MPFRANIGKELTRSTICVRRSRVAVTLMCSDRIPAGAASDLLVGIDWTNFEDDVTLTFRKLGAAGGEIRFDAAAGPASRTFPSATRDLVPIFGVTPTVGVAPDVMLDVAVGGEVLESVPLSVGPVATTVAIRAADGVSPAPDLLLPDVGVRLKAVPSPAGRGTFRWLSVQPAAVAIVGSFTADSVVVWPPAAGSLSLLGLGPPVGVCVLFTPPAGPAVMAVNRTRTLFDPDKPGPFRVGRTTYTGADFTISGPLEGILGSIDVSMEALVRYPAEVAGDDTPFSPNRAKYPLVILAHGRHWPAEYERHPDGSRKRTVTCATTPLRDMLGMRPEFKNHEGLEYLASHLASHGFIAVSVNLNGKFNPVTGDAELFAPQGTGVTCHTADNVAIAHRASTILRHIQLIKDTISLTPLFAGKVDLDRVGLVGHSRGGESVAAAQVINRGLPPVDQASIKAVVSIAPTDSIGHIVNSPFLAIIGSDDGDVYNVQGLRLYDRADTPKQLVWVIGGIHNFFSSVWQWQDEVPAVPPVSRPQHEQIAKGYCNLFLQEHLRGMVGTAAYFSGERRIASLAPVELHHSLRRPGALLVDDFETLPRDRTRNALLGAVVPTDLVGYDEEALNGLDPGCAPSRPSWFQDTTGLVVEWAVPTARYRTDLGGMDASADGMVLSFRVGQDLTGNPPGLSQNFRVTLADGVGRKATLRVGDFATIPPPRSKNVINHAAGLIPVTCAPITFGVTLCWLKTVRLPIAGFKAKNVSLNTADIASITFEFTSTSSGRLALDDLEFCF
jgi:hypothetical protein